VHAVGAASITSGLASRTAASLELPVFVLEGAQALTSTTRQVVACNHVHATCFRGMLMRLATIADPPVQQAP